MSLLPTTIRRQPSDAERQIARAIALALRAEWVTSDDIERAAHLVAGALSAAFQIGVKHAVEQLAEGK